MLNLCRARPIATLVAVAFISIAFTSISHAQTPTPTPAPAIPAANSADVATMDSIVAALYDVISGPAGTRNGIVFARYSRRARG